MSQSEAKEAAVDTPQTITPEEPQYPGLRVVIPTTIAVVLAVFVASLVSILSRLADMMKCLTTSTRIELSLASLFPPFPMTSTPLKTYHGTNQHTSSQMQLSNSQWAKSM